MFGGVGYPGQGSTGNLNDLFKYTHQTGQWTWMKGDTTIHAPGVYGTAGSPSASNKPGGRHYNSWWTDQNGAFWLFGGLGRDKNTVKIDNMNDLWKIEPPCNPVFLSAVNSTLCVGGTASLSMSPPDNSQVSWYNSPSSTVALGTGSTYVTAPLPSPATYSYYASVATCSAAPRSVAVLTVYALPQISISAPAAVCHGSTFTVSASGGQTYTWNTGSGSAVITLTAGLPGNTVVVIGTDQYGCENSATSTVAVNPLPTVSATSSKTLECYTAPVTFSASGAQSFLWSGGQTTASFSLSNLPIGTNTFAVTGTDANGCKSTATLSFVSSECLGLQSQDAGHVRIYPNPARGFLYIEPQKDRAEVTIHDAIGRRVYYAPALRSGTPIVFDLPPGVYVLSHGEGGATRFIVE